MITLIAEDHGGQGIFKVLITVGKDQLYFLKKDSAYDLAVNRASFKKLPTSGDTNVDRRLAETFPRFNNFTSHREGEGWVLVRNGPSLPFSPSPSPQQHHAPPTGIPTSPPPQNTYNLLNDSAEAYDHRFYFLPIEEANEDPALIRFVNIAL